MHWRWLGEQAFPSPLQRFVFGECVRRIEEAQARCDRLDGALQEATGSWSLAPLAKALQALRGVGLVVAATLATEIGDLSRFRTPKQLEENPIFAMKRAGCGYGFYRQLQLGTSCMVIARRADQPLGETPHPPPSDGHWV